MGVIPTDEITIGRESEEIESPSFAEVPDTAQLFVPLSLSLSLFLFVFVSHSLSQSKD